MLDRQIGEAPDYSHRVQGESYLTVLERLHAALEPGAYLEIGTEAGDSLRLASCASIAVDPAFQIRGDVIGRKPVCHFFQMRSDDFFLRHDPRAALGAPVDLAFLDGLHQFEVLLRDVINTERYCRPSSIIAIHDCFPPDIYMTARSKACVDWGRSRFPNWWAGDVWRIVPILDRYRPDLTVIKLDAAPTGLLLITGLDPTNTALHDSYAETVAWMTRPGLVSEEFDAFWAGQTLTPCAALASPEDFARHFRPTAPFVIPIWPSGQDRDP